MYQARTSTEARQGYRISLGFKSLILVLGEDGAGLVARTDAGVRGQSARSLVSPSTKRRIPSGLAFCSASGNSASG